MKEIRRIFSYLIPFRKQVVLHILFSIFSTLFALFSIGMVLPFLEMLFGLQTAVEDLPGFQMEFSVIKQYIYFYLGELVGRFGKLQTLGLVSIGVVILTFIKTGFHYLAMYMLAPIRSGVVRDLRNQVYRKILGLHLGYFSDERKGDLISRMTSDVSEIEWSILSALDAVFRSPIAILFYVSSLFFIDVRLTLFILILIPLAGFFIGLLSRTLRKTSAEAQSNMGLILTIIEETIGGLRIVKAFNAERMIERSFLGRNELFTKLMTRILRRRYLATPLTEFLGTIVVAITMWFGGMLVLGDRGFMDPEDLITYLLLFSQVIPPAKSFSTAHYNVQKGLASVDRLNEVMNVESVITDKPGAIAKSSFEKEIEFRNVSFRYGEEDVLKQISFVLPKGKTLAIVGQSGAGKSTLADLIPRFYDPRDGEILIDGVALPDLRVTDLRHLLGIVNQDPILFNDSIYNNIAFGAENAGEEEVRRAASIANALEFIETDEKGFESNVGDRGSRLSGGQRQRLSIARAVLKDPPILILDEATSSLDSESEHLVQEAITKLMSNRTTIVIAHRLSTIRNADQIIVLDKGDLIEQGSHDELMAMNGNYRKLYEMQMFG